MSNHKPENRIKESEPEGSDLNSNQIFTYLRNEVSFIQAIETAIPSGIVVIDDAGRQVYVNQSFCRMVGMDEKELLGKSAPYEYWAQHDIENISSALKLGLNNEAPKKGFDLLFSHKTGKLIPVNIIISSFNMENNRTYLLANVIDLTERKKAEEALKESETKLKGIINQINDGIIVFDEQAKVIIWNKGAEQICGLNADDILNQSIVDLYFQLLPPPLNDRALVEKEINEIITLKTPEIFDQIIDNEIIPYNSDNLRNIQRKIFPIKLKGYHLFCMVFRDSTEIKRYEKEILRISADKDKFYSAIAHYMYTPINTFYNFAKVMAVEMDNLPIKEIQKMAVTMSKSATNLYSLLDNLLQWTRMNQGNITFKPEKLNFIKTSQDAISILKPNADLKNIKINHLAADEITVFADIFMIKTVLRNLVSNAIRFTASDGQIDISAQQTTSHVTISVIDNGSGLSPANLAKLFSGSEIHSILDAGEEKGTTLGLLLCKEFIEKHGGKIWVEHSKGRGSEIKFTLPTYT